MSDYYSDPYKDDYKAWLIGGIVFSIIALAIFGVGCYLLARQIQASKFTAVDAVVVDHKMRREKYHNSYANYYYDVVEYEIEGTKYIITCDTMASRDYPPDDIGKIITIYVNSTNPKDVVFSNSTHILLTVLCVAVPICGSVGIAFIFRKAHKIKNDN